MNFDFNATEHHEDDKGFSGKGVNPHGGDPPKRVNLLAAPGKRRLISNVHADLAANIIVKGDKKSIQAIDASELKELLISLVAFHGHKKTADMLYKALVKIYVKDRLSKAGKNPDKTLLDDIELLAVDQAEINVNKIINARGVWPSSEEVAQKIYNTINSVDIDNRVPLYRDDLAFKTSIAMARAEGSPKSQEKLEKNYASLSRKLQALQPKVKATQREAIAYQGREVEIAKRQLQRFNPINAINETMFEISDGLIGSAHSKEIRSSRFELLALRLDNILETIFTESFAALFSGKPSEELEILARGNIEGLGSALTSGGEHEEDQQNTIVQESLERSPILIEIEKRLKELESIVRPVKEHEDEDEVSYSKSQQSAAFDYDPDESESEALAKASRITKNPITSILTNFFTQKRVPEGSLAVPQVDNSLFGIEDSEIHAPTEFHHIQPADELNSQLEIGIKEDGNEDIQTATETKAQLSLTIKRLQTLEKTATQGGQSLLATIGEMIAIRVALRILTRWVITAGAWIASASAGLLGVGVGALAASVAVVGGLLVGANELFTQDTRNEIRRIEDLQVEDEAPGSNIYGVSDVEREASARYAERMGIVTPIETPSQAERLETAAAPVPEADSDVEEEEEIVVVAPRPIQGSEPTPVPSRTSVPDHSRIRERSKTFDITPKLGGMDRASMKFEAFL